MRLAGDNTAYVVSIPGVEGYMNSYFAPEAETWRENVILNMKAEDIAMVQISFSESAEEVRLERQTEGWKLMINRQERQIDPAQLELYIAQYSGKIYGESFAATNFPTMTDSLSRRDPDIRLALTNRAGNTQQLGLYKRPENLNNYFGFVSGSKQLRTVQTFVIDPLLKGSGNW